MIPPFGVVPVLVGPLQTLLALLPSLLLGLGTSILALFRPATFKRLLALLWSQKLAVVVGAGVIGGAVWLHATLFPPVRDVVSASDAGSADWPMFRGGPERSGVAGEGPLQGGVQWSFSRDGIKTIYSSPAVVGNRVYSASADYGPLRDRGAICSIDADTGKLVWEYQEGGYRATFSSPAVSGKYLVCGEGLHYTRDARIVCIDVEQSEAQRRGVKLWELRTRSHVESSPCIADGKVFIGAGDDGIYCIALEPDGVGQPAVLWHLDGKDFPDAESSPLYHDGRLYFGLGDGGKAICCVNAANGKELWRIATPYPVFGCPAIAEGKLCIGMGNGNYIESAEQAAAKQIEKLKRAGKGPEEIAAAAEQLRAAGEVWCVDLRSHQVEWKYAVGKTILGAVAVADGRLYFGSTDGYLYCLSAQGVLLRRWNAHAPIIASPAAGTRQVYVATQTGQLSCLDAATLQLVWEARVDTGGQLFSSPAVARGHVYLGTTSNGLVCIGEAGRPVEKPLWPGCLGGPGKSGWTDGSLLPPRGVFAWRFPAPREDQPDEGPAPKIHAPLAHMGREIFVGLDGFHLEVSQPHPPAGTSRHGLACLTLGERAADLEVSRPHPPAGTGPDLRWFYPTTNPVYLSAVANEEAVWVVDGRPGDSGRQLHCLDPRTGKPLWQRPVASLASGQMLLASRSLFIADQADSLSCLDSAGASSWSAPIGFCCSMPLLLDQILIVATVEPPALVALDAPTGQELWRSSLDGKPQTGPVAVFEVSRPHPPAGTGNDRIWLGTAEGVAAFDLVHGEQVAVIRCGSMQGSLLSDGDRLAGVTETGHIIVIDPTQGKEVQRIAGARADLPPVWAGDILLFADQRSIRRHDLATGQTTRWMDAAWLGGVTAPLSVRDSHVLFATKRGLVCAKPSK